MKKNILMALLVSLGLVLTGCGSGDFDINGGNDGNSSISDTNNTDNNGSTGSGNVTSVYRFMNAQSAIVSSGGQDKNISVQLVDSDGVGVAGETVKIKSLPQKYGAIGPATAKTDASGIATFHYRAPLEISLLNGKNQTVTFLYTNASGHTISTNAWITFNNQVVDPGTNLVKPVVVIPQDKRTITLHDNSQSEVIAIKVFKEGAPYTGGTVKVQLPSKVLGGADVGLFDAYEVKPNAQGIAVFNYTGPGNLSDLISGGDQSSIFKFYHTENIEAKSEMLVKYVQPNSTHVTRNYSIDVSTNGQFSMGIPDKQKTFSISLKAKDGSGNDIQLSNESNIKIHVETTNGTIAQIVSGTNLVDTKDLNVADFKGSFTLQSKKLSGLVPMKVTMEFTDVNGKTHLISGGDYPALTTIINVRVFSGPPSAISISYAGTSQDADRSKYIEKFAISVTDEYGNKVNTHPNISIGAIAGYTVDGKEAQNVETNETKRLFYGRQDIQNNRANGTLEALGGNKAQFLDNTAVRSSVFKYADSEGNHTDKLVVFGERKNYEAMGKWDIKSIANDHTLELEDDYYGVNRSGLYYAVGHNYYQDQCRADGREWIGTTDASSYEIDDEGTAVVRYAYDYHLSGKDVLVWVNLDGIQPDTGEKTRIGEVLKHTLRTTGLTQVPEGGYSLDKGGHGYGTFIIWHENAPERYRNAHFGYAIKGGSTCGYRLVAGSNRFDARTCSNKVGVDINGNGTIESDEYFGTSDGTSYVTFELWASHDKACTFNIERIMVSREF